MNRAELESLAPGELRQVANDLGVRTKKRSNQEIIAAVLQSIDGEGDDLPEVSVEKQFEADSAEETAFESEATPPVEEGSGTIGEVQPVPRGKTDRFVKNHPELAERIEEEKAAIAAQPPEPRLHAEQAFDPNHAVSNDWPTLAEAKKALESHVKRGLVIEKMTEEFWHFKVFSREAAGSMKMPLSQIIFQANILLRPTRHPTEE